MYLRRNNLGVKRVNNLHTIFPWLNRDIIRRTWEIEAGIVGNKLWGMLARSHMPSGGTNFLTTPNNDFQPPWNSETLSLSAWLSSLDVTVSAPALTWKTLYSIDSFLFLMNVNEHDFYCKHFITSLETTCNTLGKRNIVFYCCCFVLFLISPSGCVAITAL